MFLRECKYVIRKKKIPKYITDNIEISPDPDRENSDEKNLMKKLLMEKILIKKIKKTLV